MDKQGEGINRGEEGFCIVGEEEDENREDQIEGEGGKRKGVIKKYLMLHG